MNFDEIRLIITLRFLYDNLPTIRGKDNKFIAENFFVFLFAFFKEHQQRKNPENALKRKPYRENLLLYKGLVNDFSFIENFYVTF